MVISLTPSLFRAWHGSLRKKPFTCTCPAQKSVCYLFSQEYTHVILCYPTARPISRVLYIIVFDVILQRIHYNHNFVSVTIQWTLTKWFWNTDTYEKMIMLHKYVKVSINIEKKHFFGQKNKNIFILSKKMKWYTREETKIRRSSSQICNL